MSATTLEHGCDLLALTGEKERELKERIAKWNGLVRIFVHPMYEKWRWGTDKYANDPDSIKLVQIENVLAKLLKMPKDATPPIIIFEETEFVGELQKWLAGNHHQDSRNGVYFVKTLPNNPTPEIDPQDTRNIFRYGSQGSAWKRLARTLARLGVKKILIGGLYLQVTTWDKDWTGKGPFLGRCVGIAISYLSKTKAGRFDLEVSALVCYTPR